MPIRQTPGFLISAANILALAIGLVMATHVAAIAAPKAELWERWNMHDPKSTARVDHGEWSRLLAAYTDTSPGRVARFDYAKVSKADKAALDAYVTRLAGTPISRFGRAEQFAYWVNFYNALTVKVILDHFPVKSIRDIDISPGWFADGPWGAKLVTVEGEKISLDDIEHRILRPIWKDPRIHYVVNCASIGCPDIPPVAVTPENAEKLLNEGAVRYINHPRGVKAADGRIVVSSIYSWFQADFGGNETGVLDHIRKYASDSLKSRLKGRDEYDDHDYDWRLNGK